MNKAKSELGFEEAIEHHLLIHGWGKVPNTGFDAGLGLAPGEVVEFLKTSQPDEWDKLVTRVGAGSEAKAAEKVVAYIAGEVDRRGTVHVLRNPTKMNGVTFRLAFFAPANTLTPVLWERYSANRLGVSRQVHYSATDTALSLDMVLLVNGLPTATVELKNPLTGQNVEDAMRQYRYDRKPSEVIFRDRAVVHFAVDPDQVYMTTELAAKQTRFLPFNQGSAGAGNPGGAGNPPNPDGYRTAYLWEQVWAREAWLELLGTFVHAEDVRDENRRKTGKRRMLFPRYHQWDAVRRLLADTLATGPGVNRLVQHSAGSGKSNTIAWTAHRLTRLHTPGDPAGLSPAVRAGGLGTDAPLFHKVVVVTDRRALDSQLQDTVGALEHTPGVLVRIDEKMTSADLQAALESNAARIIVTTLQKFPVVAGYLAADGGQVAGRRFAVIVDEAHSSTSGEAMKDLKGVLGAPGDDAAALAAHEAREGAVEDARPDAADVLAESMAARGGHANLSFYAFTATPKPKTLELFGTRCTLPGGEVVLRPFHTYAMRQAIDERFILDVLANYTTYDTYYRLANSAPEDPEVPVSKASAALARYVSLHPSNLAQKAEIIVEHFRRKTAAKIGGKAKAMVVTRSRLHAVRYKKAIDAYIAAKGYGAGAHPVRTLVAFSGQVVDPAAPTVAYAEAAMNGIKESALPETFAGEDYQVLVVAEKYQTGFDQPLLHTMYVDKKLDGVKAVQTLSRLNRVHPEKDDTFVLDFANDPEGIQDAFRPFYEETSATPTDPNVLYAMHTTLTGHGVLHAPEMAKAVAALLSGQSAKQKTVYANLHPARDRYTALDGADQDAFRDTLRRYVSAYAFLAQVMPWTDPDLETCYLYGKALLAVLPRGDTDPMPQLDDSVILTHLRIAAAAREADLSIDEGTDTPGAALPGGGQGRTHDVPLEPLSVLIKTMNERYGIEFTDVDIVWADQQKQVVKSDPTLRAIALHNDEHNFRRALDQYADAAIIERHEANTDLFNAYFEKPGFRDAFITFLAQAYPEIRAESAG